MLKVKNIERINDFIKIEEFDRDEERYIAISDIIEVQVIDNSVYLIKANGGAFLREMTSRRGAKDLVNSIIGKR